MDTPLDITNPKGPKFHFTQVSEREQLGRDLAEKVIFQIHRSDLLRHKRVVHRV